jgi:predicted MFS family arabinose efflux permease
VLLTTGLGSSWTILLISVLLGMFVVLFVRRERRFSEPLVEFALFRNRTFTIANVSVLLSNMMMYSTLLVIPLLMVYRFQMPVGQVGWVLFAFSCSLSLCSALGGILSDKFGQRTIINFSFFVSVLAMLLYLGMFAIDSVVYLVLSLLVGGIGAGIGMTAMQVAVLQSVKKEMSGIGTGIFSTFRYIGGIIGSTLIGFLSQSPVLFVILFAFGVVGLTLSFGFPKQIQPDMANKERQSVSSSFKS